MDILLKNLTDVPFITSDNPIFRIPRFYDNPDGGIEIPFLNDRLELYYPISPIATILLMRRESHEYERLKRFRNRLLPISNLEYVHCINQVNIYRAHERIFYRREHEALIKKYLNEKSQFKRKHTYI